MTESLTSWYMEITTCPYRRLTLEPTLAPMSRFWLCTTALARYARDVRDNHFPE